MSKKIYTKSFWGKEFINAIGEIDSDSRLGRGKTYANTKRVLNMTIEKNFVIAKVKGNYGIYNIKIEFKTFNEKEKKIIIKIIKENQIILAQLLQGNLPEELLFKLNSKNINIVPKSWNEINGNCSCPDWANPCKHLAAVYYHLSEEIDKNPFNLFKLKGIDLYENFNINPIKYEIKYPIEIKKLIKNKKLEQIRIQNLPKLIKIPNSKNFILSILSDFPRFSSINYKNVLDKFYDNFNRNINKNLKLNNYFLEKEEFVEIEKIISNSEIDFIGDKYFRKIKVKFKNDILINKKFKNIENYFKKIENNIFEIDLITFFKMNLLFENPIGSPSYESFYHLSRAIFLILNSNSFIPSYLKHNEKEFSIIYKPLFKVNYVNQLLGEIKTNCQSLNVLYEDFYLEKDTAIEYLSIAIITSLIDSIDYMHSETKANPPKESLSFFKGQIYKQERFEEKSIGKSIGDYFGIFDIIDNDLNLFFYLEELNENYVLSAKIKVKEDFIPIRDYIITLKENERYKLLIFLAYLKTIYNNVTDLLTNENIYLNSNELENFILNINYIFQNLGIKIILPKELKEILKPKAIIKAKSSNKQVKTFLSMDKLLEYNWEIAIGDELIDLKEFEKIIKNGDKLIKFKDKYLNLDPNELKNILSKIEKEIKLSPIEILKGHLENEIYLDDTLKKTTQELLKQKEFELPKGLKADLREYQINGFRWGINNLLNGFGIILADDMGLGKTIQTLTILLYLKENNYLEESFLLVAPTSLLYNWENEIEKFAPSLKYSTYYGNARKIIKSDIILTSYQVFRRDLDKLKKEKFGGIIIDEAQYIKNFDSKISKSVKSIKTNYKIALSGTPVENNLSELWSIFDFTLPKYYGDFKNFKKNYANKIELEKDAIALENLRKTSSPFMLRRLKTDKNIIKDLPEKIVIDEYTYLTKEQAGIYESILNDILDKISNSEGIERKGLIFKLINSLKQICNHPAQFSKEIKNIKKEASGKTNLLISLLKSIMNSEEKVLIFTQYTQMGEILKKIIEDELNIIPLYLHGAISKKKRENLINSFQNDDSKKIFILSLKAAGVGLNLTSANHVIHYDLWWNPAVENQATDRAFRIGQKNNVFVHRLINKNTFEEKINTMILNKKELSDISVNVGESWLSEMSDLELRNLFKKND